MVWAVSRRGCWIPILGVAVTLAYALESYEVRLLDRWDKALGACKNMYARYATVSFLWSRRPSVPNLVWWNFPAKMSTYRRAHTRIMLRCWILHLPLSLLWQPHYTMALSFIGLSLFHFSIKDRASLLQPLRGLLLRGLFVDYSCGRPAPF